MTKEELALQIARAMDQGQDRFESFNAYQCIKAYFLDLEMKYLIDIANQYGINVVASELAQPVKVGIFNSYVLDIQITYQVTST